MCRAAEWASWRVSVSKFYAWCRISSLLLGHSLHEEGAGFYQKYYKVKMSSNWAGFVVESKCLPRLLIIVSVGMVQGLVKKRCTAGILYIDIG